MTWVEFEGIYYDIDKISAITEISTFHEDDEILEGFVIIIDGYEEIILSADKKNLVEFHTYLMNALKVIPINRR